MLQSLIHFSWLCIGVYHNLKFIMGKADCEWLLLNFGLHVHFLLNALVKFYSNSDNSNTDKEALKLRCRILMQSYYSRVNSRCNFPGVSLTSTEKGGLKICICDFHLKFSGINNFCSIDPSITGRKMTLVNIFCLFL